MQEDMKEVGLHLPARQAQFDRDAALILDPLRTTAVSPEPCDRDVNEFVISEHSF